ncbi:MAG: sialate O-acetylesterase [Pirellulales bacterium]|jgi:sialate O-acetylesterase
MSFDLRRLRLRLTAVMALALLLSLSGAVCPPASADVALNNMFGDHMVLQQGIRNRVWGKADAGEKVTVTLANQTHSTTAAADGSWEVMLDAVQEYGGPHSLTIKGNNTITFNDVLIGEVWVCAGQSNMQWSVNASNDADLERASASYPEIRLISVPQVGTQEPQWNFNGSWKQCSPETVGNFSAVGYLFGRQLHQTLGVPVGLINNAWGGSAAEAWVNREKLAEDSRFEKLLARWEQTEKEKADDKGLMNGNHRPANIYNGVLKPSIGYGIRGAIWYQGESNAGRAYQYRDLFPYMIKTWREEWGLGDFPFYWVQLADFRDEKAEPAESDWAELREAQTMTMDALPATGEAVIIDIGEGKDIHPKNKQDVAKRLARWALAETYAVAGIPCHSPRYASMEKDGSKIVLSFEHVDGGWRPFDVPRPVGFTIAGADKAFVHANATIREDGRIEVSAEGVSDPVAVRYAWADNPVCNMFDGAGLPLTPFRTDDFPGVTVNNH